MICNKKQERKDREKGKYVFLIFSAVFSVSILETLRKNDIFPLRKTFFVEAVKQMMKGLSYENRNSIETFRNKSIVSRSR